MELRVIKNLEELESIKAGWESLLQYPCNRGIHQSFDWFSISYQSFHIKDEMNVLAIIDDKRTLIGIAPLVIYSGVYRGITVRKIGFLRNNQNPANDFVFDPGNENVCMKLIFEHLCSFSKWNLIDLQQVQIDGTTGNLLRKTLEEKSYAFGLKSNRQSPYIDIDTDWEDFWKSKSQRFKKTMRNKINRANCHGGVVIEKIPLEGGHAPELEEMKRISRNSWKYVAGTDLSSCECRLKFYKSLCDIWGPKGHVFAWFLKINEMPVAFEFHIEYKGTVYPIRADYDENFKSLSPGSLLEYEIIQNIFKSNKYTEYHSCGHTYDYLLNWTYKTKNYVNFEIFSKTLVMSILYKFEYEILVALRKMPYLMKIKNIGKGLVNL